MKKKLTNKHNGAIVIDKGIYYETKEAYYFVGEYGQLTEYDKANWEISDCEDGDDYEEKPPLYYIIGVKDRGNEVIKMLEDRGGKNSNYLSGDSYSGMYFIGSNNVIQLIFKEHNKFSVEILEKYGTELHLPEKDADNEIKTALQTEYEKGRADVIAKLKKFLDENEK